MGNRTAAAFVNHLDDDSDEGHDTLWSVGQDETVRYDKYSVERGDHLVLHIVYDRSRGRRRRSMIRSGSGGHDSTVRRTTMIHVLGLDLHEAMETRSRSSVSASSRLRRPWPWPGGRWCDVPEVLYHPGSGPPISLPSVTWKLGGTKGISHVLENTKPLKRAEYIFVASHRSSVSCIYVCMYDLTSGVRDVQSV